MDAYTVQSTFYDTVLEPLNAPMRKAAMRLCPPTPGAVVLDAACGTGAALADYRDAGCRLIGTDTSPAMLARARARLGGDADLRMADGRTLPVEAQCADLVVLSLVLHSVPRRSALSLLSEAARALRPGGRILVTDFGVGSLRFPRGYLTRGFTTIAEIMSGPQHAGNCLAYLRAGGLSSLVEESGLMIEASRPTAGGNIEIAVLLPPPRGSQSA